MVGYCPEIGSFFSSPASVVASIFELNLHFCSLFLPSFTPPLLSFFRTLFGQLCTQSGCVTGSEVDPTGSLWYSAWLGHQVSTAVLKLTLPGHYGIENKG